MTRVHAHACVDGSAQIADDVEIGPYAVVQSGARIGAGTRIGSHAVVSTGTTIGNACDLHPFSVVGGAPQLHHKPNSARTGFGADGECEIGNNTVIREHVTIHRGSAGGVTRVGADCLLMVGVHVGHDAVVGSHVTIANGVQLAGHVVVGDHVTFGGLAAVGPHVHIGELAFIAAGAMVERDVPPFFIVQGDRARPRGVNRVGMKRQNHTLAEIRDVERVFLALYGPTKNRAHVATTAAGEALLRAIEGSNPGLQASVRTGRHRRSASR